MEFSLRNSADLIGQISTAGVVTAPTISTAPKLSNVQVWANYALVSNNERKKMGCAPRDIVIEQAQQVGGVNGAVKMSVASTTTTTSVDLRLAHAVKALFFGAKNKVGTGGIRSNYGTGSIVADPMSAVSLFGTLELPRTKMFLEQMQTVLWLQHSIFLSHNKISHSMGLVLYGHLIPEILLELLS